MNGRVLRGNLMLVLTALIWGVAFVAQQEGMAHMGPFSFNAIRTMLAAAVLSPLCIIRRRRANVDMRQLLVGGAITGVLLSVASNLQQCGLMYTSSGKAGFITAIYIIIVPIIGLIIGKKVPVHFFVAVGLAMVGMYFLTLSAGVGMSAGDLLVLMSAIVYALHIMAIAHFAPKVDGVLMSMVQFVVSLTLTSIPMLLFEQPSLDGIRLSLVPLLYTGVLSSGLGYTLQIVAQSDVNPVVASLIMSLESVFAVLAGWLIQRQALTGRELAGCALVFISIILAQLPARNTKREGTIKER